MNHIISTDVLLHYETVYLNFDNHHRDNVFIYHTEGKFETDIDLSSSFDNFSDASDGKFMAFMCTRQCTRATHCSLSRTKII